jgi:hypothetical protein
LAHGDRHWRAENQRAFQWMEGLYGSGGQRLATACTTGAQYLATANSGRAAAEAVTTLAHKAARLESALHWSILDQ